ncbi:hypothetical protein [Nicoliella lavandulae]|uniref:ASCH domain-containing protein n=1 Tax=Nicoliella lavandulae TaxID=3082954 RepID=A0ABU8SJ99_9LACO
MDVLISIKPKYVNEIINGNKKYEFRKHAFKKPVDYIYIYETRPIMKVTHKFKLTDVIIDTPNNIWNKCSSVSGMNLSDFSRYYQNSNKAVAIKIDKLETLEEPLSLSDLDVKQAPQSFIYLNH